MEAPPDADSQDRTLAATGRSRWVRRALIGGVILALVAGAGVAYAVTNHDSSDATRGATGATTVSTAQTTTTVEETTTTTIPDVVQPPAVNLPDPGRLTVGSTGATVLAYEQRLEQLHFDPGEVDGVFDQRTQFAVVSAQKYAGLTRNGVIDTAVQWALSVFAYSPAEPKAEGNRVEIDLDRQTLTVFHDWQPVLITTTSTGSGEYFCGGADGCQYAITPTGRYRFWSRHNGWKEGELGRMYNPVFFNGGIAVHGLESVPAQPASHGCSRIPMYVAEYFPTLVENGGTVYVVGTAKQAGDRYVGPTTTTPMTRPPATSPPAPPATDPPPPATDPPPPTTPPTTAEG